MADDKLIIGDYYYNILCESFIDPETHRIRVRPLPDQDVPTHLVIECSRKTREENPVGTVFSAESVKVCVKERGRIYLRAKGQKIERVDVNED